MNKKHIYCCYSLELRNFFTKHGVRYEVVGLNPNNNQMFWAYIRTDKLNNILNLWTVKNI